MYMDWGLQIVSADGEDLYYSPSSLSNESYGHKPNPERGFDDWDDAEAASLEGDEGAFVPWDEADWKESLKSEADELLEAYTVNCAGCEKVINSQTADMPVSGDFYCAGCSPE